MRRKYTSCFAKLDPNETIVLQTPTKYSELQSERWHPNLNKKFHHEDSIAVFIMLMKVAKWSLFPVEE